MTMLDGLLPATGQIVSNTGTAAFPVAGRDAIVVFMVLSGVASANFTFEGSLNSTDGSNGDWFAILGIQTSGASAEATTGILSATPAYGWMFDTLGVAWFRVRATSGTFGTATVFMSSSQASRGNMIALVSNSNLAGASANQVQGAAARNSAAPGNPLYVATARSTNIAAITDGRNVDLWADLAGKLVTTLYAPSDLTWQYFSASDGSPINTAGNTTLRAAVATYRNYVAALQIINVGGTATEVVLQDSAATPTVMWRTWLPANMAVARDIVFPVPLRTNGSGTASGVVLRVVTGGCAIYVGAQGFSAL